MSLWSKITGFLGKVAPILSIIPGVGPIAAAIGKVSAVASAVGAAVGRAPPQRVMPGAGVMGPPAPRRRVGRRAAFEFPQRLGGRRFTTTPPIRVGSRAPLPQLSTVRTMDMSIFAGLPALGRAAGPLIAAGRRALGGRAGTAVAGFAAGGLIGGGGAPDEAGRCPVGFHLNKQDGVGGPAMSYCVRNRRMNVGNARAARRSVRRLKGARKLLKDIEKMMPARQRARRALPAPHLPAPHQH